MEATVFLVLLWGQPVSGFVASSAAACEEVAASVRTDLAAVLRAQPGSPDVHEAVLPIQDWSVECRPLPDVPPELFGAQF